MTPTFTIYDDKTTVILKAKIDFFDMAHLQYFHEKEKNICKLRGVPKSFQLDVCLKTV